MKTLVLMQTGNHSRTIVQNFGHSRTNCAGGEKLGEIGGRIFRSLAPATYAKIIPIKTLNNPFTVSGKFAVTEADGNSGVLIGWFHSTDRDRLLLHLMTRQLH